MAVRLDDLDSQYLRVLGIRKKVTTDTQLDADDSENRKYEFTVYLTGN